MAGKKRKKAKKSNGVLVPPGKRGGKGSMATKLRERADTAFRLLNEIKAHRIDPEDLSVSQRRACLLLMANVSQSSVEMAIVLKVKPKTIRTDLKLIREELGREVREFTMEEVLGDLALAADRCSAQAMRNEDAGLAWTIKRDFAKLLKDFGIIGDNTKRNALTITLEQVGEGYERARAALSRGLDPRLTGEVIDVDVLESTPATKKTLPLDRRLSSVQDVEEDHESTQEEEESSV